jgi:hypothetical protein
MTLTVSPTLKALLDAGAGFDCEYRGGLSNHRPMALLALERLGAGAQRLERFDAHYTRRLQPAPPSAEWPAGEPWASRLGQRDAWPLYRHLFWHWLASEDAGEVLRQALPRLMRGCGAAAFHALIRTAYAVQAQHHQELADALAYWACRWLDLGAPVAGSEPEPEAVLRALPVVASDAGLIFQRMQHAAADTRFQAVAARLAVHPGTLQRLAELAARAHGASGNFTALHLLTGAHAMHVLEPYLVDAPAAVADYARAFCAAVCVAEIRPAEPAPLRPWPEIVRRALASDDDHVIKAVFSAHELHAVYGGRHWRAAAARAVA